MNEYSERRRYVGQVSGTSSSSTRYKIVGWIAGRVESCVGFLKIQIPVTQWLFVCGNRNRCTLQEAREEMDKYLQYFLWCYGCMVVR